VTLSATLFSDPGCPWAYSAAPALTALAWHYGDGVEWRLVLIGLTERGEQYTAPSLLLSDGERTLEGGGFQPLEAYDVLVANLDPTLPRAGGVRSESLEPALARFPTGLTTQEVALVMTHGNDAPDRGAAEDALIDLAAAGAVRRQPLADDALWVVA